MSRDLAVPGDARPYVAYQTRQPIRIDGDLTKPVWQKAQRSPRFVDVIGGTPGLYDTRAAVLWDAAALYVGFWIQEPFVQATQTQRDTLVFLDNDVEVFIDGGDTYYEFEINALATIYEVFFIWRDAYAKGGRFEVPEFDVHGRKALTFGGNHDRNAKNFWWGTHPRGLRWAFLDWDLPGLQAAVKVDGVVNDPTRQSGAWTVELAFPWAGMKWLANGRPIPPRQGDQWRIFFGRYEKMAINGETTHAGWSWHPIGSNDNHVPERFTPVEFSTQVIE